MAKKTIDISVSGAIQTQDIVVENATGADVGAVAPARALQVGGLLVSETNKLPVSVVFPTTQAVSLAALPALPTGSNTIGSVGLQFASAPVSGSNRLPVDVSFPTTQAVSLAALPALPTGSNTIGSVGLVVGGSAVGIANPLPIHRTSRSFAAANFATATNAAATVTYAAVPSQSNVISGVAFSYSGNPAGGSLTITDGGTPVFSIDISSGGAGFIPFDAPIRSATNSILAITLAAGGTGIVGKVSVFSRWTEA